MRATQILATAIFVVGMHAVGTSLNAIAQPVDSQFISLSSGTSRQPENAKVPFERPVLAFDENESDSDQAGSVLGALMLCGGGQLPNALLETFFELGQATQGSLVIIPSASAMADQDDLSWSTRPWQQFPWASIKVLHARNRDAVDSDAEFTKPLQQATAVWISGGDQGRLAERYLGTSVEQELKRVVRRGGVIGGTSAGSAIASRVMITGGRQQPVLGSGLDLLPGSIIDQHFSQRKRHDRLVSAVRQHPDRVGIGIDESTGLVVSRHQARVVGAGSVYVYSPKEPDAEALEPLKFESGSAFSLSQYRRSTK